MAGRDHGWARPEALYRSRGMCEAILMRGALGLPSLAMDRRSSEATLDEWVPAYSRRPR
jgi:hypothetical protein